MFKIHSLKYDKEGSVCTDKDSVTWVMFEHDNGKVYISTEDKKPKSEYIALMEDYLEMFDNNTFKDPLSDMDTGNKTVLYRWSIRTSCFENVSPRLVGTLKGHPQFEDGGHFATSLPADYHVDHRSEELIVSDMNTVIHCPLRYADYRLIESKGTADFIEDYEKYSAKYDKAPTFFKPDKDGSLVLLFSDFNENYFNSMYCVLLGESKPVKYYSYTHLGTIADSFLVQDEDGYSCLVNGLDIRFFPGKWPIRFYRENTKGMPWYIYNIGYSVLVFKTSCGLIRVAPNMCKRVCEENVEKGEEN